MKTGVGGHSITTLVWRVLGRATVGSVVLANRETVVSQIAIERIVLIHDTHIHLLPPPTPSPHHTYTQPNSDAVVGAADSNGFFVTDRSVPATLQ